MKKSSKKLKAPDIDDLESHYIKIGFSELEEALKIRKEGGQLIILASRPAVGKSSLALNIASSFVETERKPVAFFSLEMLSKEIKLRTLSQKAKVKARSICEANLEDPVLRDVGGHVLSLFQSSIFLNDNHDTDLEKLKSYSLKIKDEHGLGLVIIDYLQLLSCTKKSLSKEQQITNITSGLKSTAKELGVPIIALSQLSRRLESREDKRPLLSDLPERSSIESYADIVMFLYRDVIYNPDNLRPNNAEVIIAKNGSGQTKTVDLEWQPDYVNFINPETGGI